MHELTEQQIREDNPRFGPTIRIIESRPYTAKLFDFTFLKTVGAEGSKWPGEKGKVFDAWATYLWSPSKDAWVLGAN